MQTKDLTGILSAIGTAGGELCAIDRDWKRSSAVNRGKRAMLHSYYEIMQEQKDDAKQLTSHYFLKSTEPRPGPSSAK
jgi:hypothetical protein